MFFIKQTVCVVLLTLTAVTLAQIPIPKRMQGYVFNKVSNDAPIHLDIHMGPLCPDSAMALPPAKEVAMHYGSKVRLTLHMFPLPYHHQAYLTAIVSLMFCFYLSSGRLHCTYRTDTFGVDA